MIQRNKMMKKGFTLIEILVVIAILSILMGLLFPVFAQSKEQAKSTVCATNQSLIGKSMVLYGADYDDYLPYSPSPITKATEQRKKDLGGEYDQRILSLKDLSELLNVYGAIKFQFFCPLDRMDAILNKEGVQESTWFEAFGSSYMFDDQNFLVPTIWASYPEPASNSISWDGGYFHGGYDILTGQKNALHADLHLKRRSWFDISNSLYRPAR